MGAPRLRPVLGFSGGLVERAQPLRGRGGLPGALRRVPRILVAGVELAAFVALRLHEPALPRPWRVGGGAVGMWLAAGLPAAVSLAAMATAGVLNTAVGLLAALTGPVAYRV